MPDIQLALLGHFKLVVNHQPIQRLRSVREAALLAYLATEPAQPHQREQLAGLLWPDHAATAARDNLRQTLRNLRQALDDVEAAAPLLLVERQTVQFVQRDTLWLDIDHFQRIVAATRDHAHPSLPECPACMAQLAQAAALYQGPFLQNFAAIDSDLFEEWLLMQRERLQQQAMLIFEQVSASAYSQGNYAQALEYAQRQLQFDPWHERAQRQLLRSLRQLGDRPAALAQFETYQTRLITELAVMPSPETLALVAEIRNEEKRQPGEPDPADMETPKPLATASAPRAPASPNRQDWAGAVQHVALLGRSAEREQMSGWLRSGVRVIAILGLGGVGKTSLALDVAQAQAAHFDVVIWRSLINAPPPESVLSNWIHLLSDHTVTPPEHLDDQLALLINLLRRARCLLVLDNLESVLQDQKAGRYRAGYELYGQLVARIAQQPHQSCLLLTSRELPAELGTLENETPVVRTLALTGLSTSAGETLLRASGLHSSPQDAKRLVHHYSGHPLALKLVASTIHDLFQDDVTTFLSQGAPIFSDLSTLFEQYDQRLTELERVILRWLAIAREPVAPATVHAAIMPTVSTSAFLNAFQALQQRHLVEQTERGFTLQNVVMEAMTERLLEQIELDFQQASWTTLNRFALLSTHVPEYVRQSQVWVILVPLAARLIGQWGQAGLLQKVQQLLAEMRRTPRAPGYAAGNLLNLLRQLEVDLTGYDFSQLSVWQADLRRALLVDVNFRQADLRNTVFTETFRAVNAVAFSPDGQRLAAGINDGAIQLWHGPDWRPSSRFLGHTGSVQAVVFSADSQRLASASDDQTVRVWEVRSGRLLHTLVGHTHRIQAAVFSPDDDLLASSGNDQTIRLWASHTGRLLHTLSGHSDIVEDIAFSPDGRHLVSGSWDHTVCIWEVRSGQMLQTLEGHTQTVSCVAVSPTGNCVASGSWDRTVRIWDLQTGQVLHILEHTQAVGSLVFDPAGRLLASAGDEHDVRIWEVEQGQCVRVLSGHWAGLADVAFSPTGAQLASASGDRTVRLWDVQSGQPLTSLHGYTNRVRAVAFSPNGAILASNSEGVGICLWDLQRQRVRQRLPSDKDRFKVLAFGRTDEENTYCLATGGNDQAIRLWHTNARQPLHVLAGHTDTINALAFSPDGRLLASASNDRTVRVWDTQSGQTVFIFHGHASFVNTLAFSLAPAEHPHRNALQLISAGADQMIQIWSLTTGQLVHTLVGHTNVVTTLAVSPTHGCLRYLASGGWDRTVRLWDLNSGQALHVWHSHMEISCVAFSPDGQLMAVSGLSPLIEVWDVASGELRHTLQGHLDIVPTLVFQPGTANAPRLASGSYDETIKLWALDTGECVATVRAPGPYAGMQIDGILGISEAQKMALITLGAVDTENVYEK